MPLLRFLVNERSGVACCEYEMHSSGTVTMKPATDAAAYDPDAFKQKHEPLNSGQGELSPKSSWYA